MPYFTPTTFTRQTLARAEAVNSEFQAVADGFTAAEADIVAAEAAAEADRVAAAASAAAAATSETNAATSATNASTSATNAATSATTASTSATAAAASYDSFDDRYLGAKAVAPSLDNDGAALITGALYWDTAATAMYVWNGSAWNTSATDSTKLAVANNLSDLASASTARTNLGLGTAALKATGVSGDAVPVLNGAATTWAAGATFGGALTVSSGFSQFTANISGNHALQINQSHAAGLGLGVILTSSERGINVNQSGTGRAIYARGASTSTSEGTIHGEQFSSGYAGYFNGGAGLFATKVTCNMTTTASAANVYHASDGTALLRSTSSLRYKTQVEDLDPVRADTILALRPVWYRSLAEADNPTHSFYGLVAEEVHNVEKRLVHYGYLDSDYDLIEVRPATEDEPARYERRLKVGAVKVPDGVQYERLNVLMLSVIQRMEQRIKVLEAKVASLP